MTIAERVKTRRTSFDTVLKLLRWLGTWGICSFLQLWYSKSPMFWLPAGWVPGYAEWLLAFPRVPRGSISIQVWWLACTVFITMIIEALTAALKLAREHFFQVEPRKQDRAAMAMPAASRAKIS